MFLWGIIELALVQILLSLISGLTARTEKVSNTTAYTKPNQLANRNSINTSPWQSHLFLYLRSSLWSSSLQTLFGSPLKDLISIILIFQLSDFSCNEIGFLPFIPASNPEKHQSYSRFAAFLPTFSEQQSCQQNCYLKVNPFRISVDRALVEVQQHWFVTVVPHCCPLPPVYLFLLI